jgi:hypothetical protein
VETDEMIEAMNDLNVLMPMVLVAVPIEPIRVDDPVEPWEGMIPAQQGALLRAANYPDGFADPYKSLSLMSQSHVRLYWLSCVARAALIAADELNAFEWMDRWDDNAVAGAYTNNEPEHHKARELFWTAALRQSNGLSVTREVVVPPHRNKRVAAAHTRYSDLPRSLPSDSTPAGYTI